MRVIKSLVLGAATASALTITRRGIQPVLDNIDTMDGATKALGDAANDWDGTLFGAIGLKYKFSDMSEAVHDATEELKTQTAIDKEDQKLTNDKLQTFSTDAVAALAELQSRKPDIDDDNLGGVTHDGITDLKASVDAYFAVLVPITNAAEKDGVDSAQSALDGALQKTIDLFA